MYQSHLVQEIYHTYMVLEVNDDLPDDQFGVKILQSNQLKYFAPLQLRSKDGHTQYYYEITNSKSFIPLAEHDIDEHKLDIFIESLNKALDEIEEYLLDEDCIVLENSCIYENMENGFCKFVYYPGYKQKLSLQLKAVSEYLLKKVDYNNQAAVRKVYELYHIASRENNSLNELRCMHLKQIEPSEHAPDPDPDNIEYIQEPQIAYEDKTISEDHKDSDTGDRESNIKILWFSMIAIVLIELAAGYVLYRVFNLLKLQMIILLVSAIMIITIIIGILLTKRFKRKPDDEFWKPEDFIDYGFQENARVLEGHKSDYGETTLLDHTKQNTMTMGIIFRSAKPEVCQTLRICRFPSIIGKEAADMACRISHPTISRRHAKLEQKEKQYFLTDLKSSNGTFINGEQIQPMQSVALRQGDSVIFSDIEFIFEILEVK